MKHRIPFQSVFYIAIDGEAQMHNIQVNSGGNGPFGGSPMPGYMPMPGQMPIPGQMPMPGQMPIPGSHAPGYMATSGHNMPIPGVPSGSVPSYASGYPNAYPGQTLNSPYLQVKYWNLKCIKSYQLKLLVLKFGLSFWLVGTKYLIFELFV